MARNSKGIEKVGGLWRRAASAEEGYNIGWNRIVYQKFTILLSVQYKIFENFHLVASFPR